MYHTMLLTEPGAEQMFLSLLSVLELQAAGSAARLQVRPCLMVELRPWGHGDAPGQGKGL